MCRASGREGAFEIRCRPRNRSNHTIGQADEQAGPTAPRDAARDRKRAAKEMMLRISNSDRLSQPIEICGIMSCLMLIIGRLGRATETWYICLVTCQVFVVQG